MIHAIESCAIAFMVAAVLTPIIQRLCIRFAVFDPLGPLKIHQRPVPRLGGIAITFAMVAGCVVANHVRVGALAPFFGSLTIIWVAGLVDDLHGLPPLVRLSAQAVAGLILWWAGSSSPGYGHSLWNAVAVCAFVIFFSNSLNFLDGSDGLAAGVAAIIALTFAIATGANPAHLGLVAGGLLGATAGFLVYNRHPASIFMGDAGSTTIGLTIAFLALCLSQSAATPSSSLMFSFLVAALPLLDALLAVVRRLRAGKSPFAGDRFHYYDIARTRGWTARKIALVSYAITALLGAIGWIGLQIQPGNFVMLTILIFGVLFGVALRLGSLRTDAKSADYANTAATAPMANPATVYAGAARKLIS